jgi:hypothetical protein
MLKASGVKLRPDLPAIHESHNEGAATPEVVNNSQPKQSPPKGMLSPLALSLAGPTLSEELKALSKIWGEMKKYLKIKS